jgi:hypothetical protein
MEPAFVQNSEPAEGALVSAALVLVSLERGAELFSSDPEHADSRTTATATDNPLRNTVRLRRMRKG